MRLTREVQSRQLQPPLAIVDRPLPPLIRPVALLITSGLAVTFHEKCVFTLSFSTFTDIVPYF